MTDDLYALDKAVTEAKDRVVAAADAITRLTREKSELANTAHLRFKEIVDLGVKVASARAQGAEEMREAAAKVVAEWVAGQRLVSINAITVPVSTDDQRSANHAADCLDSVLEILRALPLQGQYRR